MAKNLIKDFQSGEIITGYFGVYSKSIRSTKNDKLYLDLILVDKTGKINAKMWDNTSEVQDKFFAGDAVAIKGTVHQYQDKLQMKVNFIRLVDEEEDKKYGFDWEDLILCTQKDVEKMWSEITETIESLNNKYIKEVVSNIYSENAEKLKTYPAAQILHHAYRGGLLEHTHAMTLVARSICQVYPDIDQDLVIAGVLLHDIGKLKELSPGVAIKYSDEGNFIGHLVLGRDILRDQINKIEDFPLELRYKLEHIILAHQGKYEWASPREPGFIEAQVVFHIDELDTRIKQMGKAISSDSSENFWTTKRNYFNRPLYKGNISEQ